MYIFFLYVAGTVGLLDLPAEILVEILRMAEPSLLYLMRNISRTCKKFNEVCHCPTLWGRWSLRNVGCITYTKDNLKSIFHHAKDFRYFYFGGNYVNLSSDDASVSLGMCCNLESLDLGSNGLLRDLYFVSKLTKLKRLILDHCPEITKDALIQGLIQCPSLEVLSMFSDSQISTKDIMKVMTYMPELKVLNIECVHPITCEELLLILRTLKHIRQIQATPAHYNGTQWFSVMSQYRKVEYGVALRETLSRTQRNNLYQY